MSEASMTSEVIKMEDIRLKNPACIRKYYLYVKILYTQDLEGSVELQNMLVYE